jgi:ribosomal-protein-alanine N-acetyltransferase
MNNQIFKSFPVLKTNRLILRKLKPKDVDGVYKFYSDHTTLEYIPKEPFTKIDQAKDKLTELEKLYKEEKAIWWAFTLKSSDNFIGFGGIFNINKENNNAEIGYGLLPQFWGKGFMSELVKEIVNIGFNELKLHKLSGFITPGNTGSVKVLEKLGFEKEALLKDDVFVRNKYFNTAIYARINKTR